MHLSLRYQLGLALILVNVLLTAGVALVTYRAAHDAMVDQALGSVSLVAQGRERELLDVLEHRQERLLGFLQSLQSLCGEKGPSGRLGWEDECVRTAAGGFHRSERARATDVTYGARRLTLTGDAPAVAPPAPGQLLRIDGAASVARYSMEARIDELSVHSEFPLSDLEGVFSDRAGLESNGDAFLTDGRGGRLTGASRIDPARPFQFEGVDACVNGAAQTIQTVDERGVSVIAGLLPAAAIGGGCIVAAVSYADATAPILRLGRLLTYASALVGLFGGVVSVLLASVATRPLNRLAAAARNLGDGQFDTRVPVEGPTEVRQLGKTLSTMAASISGLVQREQTARREAEQANRTKDEFLATLSHELRTPLNAILGWASILTRSNYDRDRVTHAVHVIERNARIQAQMIEELLDVSRISSGHVSLNATDVTVTSIVDAALEAVRPAADAVGVTLHKTVDAPNLVIHADARRLQQVVWNLLSNAVRFTPAGGRVDVDVVRDGDTAEVRVRDTGCGIAPEFLPHVFEPFRQADSTTTRAHGGLGLGLAIVRDLVLLHGGSVRADSAGEGKGATFSVRLPLAPAVPDVARAPAPRAVPARLTGSRVLVVDDDTDTRDVLKALLEDAGATVTTSRSAAETRALFPDVHPDLLIADVGMPDEDGYSLIASIRRLESGASAQVPAIALTARTLPEDVEQALTSGFQLHMAKPFDARQLVDAVATLMAKPAPPAPPTRPRA